jgi:membrane fusion protein, multidrug efflux system
MKLRSFALFTALFAVLLFTAACNRSGTGNAAADNVKTKQMPAHVVAVTTVRTVTRPVSATIQATGSFIAEESSDVAPETTGLIVATPVNVGDFVRKGQIIARLDDRDAKLRLQAAQAARQQAEASVRQAQSRIGLGQGQAFDPANVPEVLAAKAAYESAVAQAKLAQADAKRYANLVNSGDVSRSAYEKAATQADTAQAQANSARQQYEATLNAARQNYQGVETQQASLTGTAAQLALAEKAVADTQIKAPFDGYVSARPVAAGEYVALTSKIATVVRLTPIKLELQIAESSAPQIALGLEVEANVPGYPGRDFQGKITAINPSVDPNARTFAVEAEFRNEDRALKPGMFATARIQLPGSEQGIFVPRRAILTDPTTNSSQVFVVQEGKARLAVVQVGEADGDMVHILSGIPANAVLAASRLQELYDGEAVSVSVSSAPGAGLYKEREPKHA